MPRSQSTVHTRDLTTAMEQIAPTRLAQPWDNVGLIAGDPEAALRRGMVCIDLTRAVLEEAIRLRSDAVVAYHPPLFKPVQSLCADATRAGPGPAVVFDAIRAGVSIYTPHTALDAADGGTGDAIARLCGATPIGTLDHAPAAGSDQEVKLVTFVPAESVQRVADAVAGAGAGHIGLYERCSFRVPGRGTFFGSEGTDPVVGKRGRLEYVDEIRLEMVCPNDRLPDAVAALRGAHPYEEPAYDIYPLSPKPGPVGIGRLARLDRPVSLLVLARKLARATKATAPQIVGRASRRIRTLAILVGSAGRVHEDFPRSSVADVLVTGEIRHHDALAIDSRGGAAIALGHWCSERPVLPVLVDRLRRHLPKVRWHVSRADRDPFQFVRG